MRKILAGSLVGLLAAGGVAWAIWGQGYYNRNFRGNFREVVPGQIYRSGQPTSEQLHAWTSRYGLKSVLNLRGGRTSDYADEKKTSDACGLARTDVLMFVDQARGTGGLLDVMRALEELPRPTLVHCAGGIDRSGLTGMMAAMAWGRESYEQARVQLESAYWGVRGADENSRKILLDYEEDCRRKGLGTGGWTELRKWLEAQPEAAPR